MKKKGDDARVPAPLGSEGGITFHNRLHPGHRYRDAVEEALRASLADLSGAWDVSVYALGRAWFRIDIVASDGAYWSTSVPVHEGPRAEDLANMVRTACLRRSCLSHGHGTRVLTTVTEDVRPGAPAGKRTERRPPSPRKET